MKPQKYIDKEKKWRLANPERVKQYYITQNKKRYAWEKIQRVFLKILIK